MPSRLRSAAATRSTSALRPAASRRCGQPRIFSSSMRRVGIVAKTRLQAAAQHLVQAASWLEARKIEPVFDPDSAALAETAGAAGRFKALDKDALAAQVDMVLVLGGDGTLLGMAG